MGRYGRIFAAELIGTMILVLGGPGTAVLATGAFGPSVEVLGVALAFGFALLVAAYAVGPVSGCHINPAVTFGSWLMRKTEGRQVPAYVGGQLVGAALGGLVIFVLASSIDGFDVSPETFAVNGWGNLSPGGFGFGAMVLAELVMTGLLVFAVLSTTSRRFAAGQVGLTVGITLALIHLISIPVDNTSVNPARSFAVAIYAGGDALEQLWAFVVFPLLGAVLGVLAWLSVDESRLEDTELGRAGVLTGARDAADRVTGRADAPE